MGNQLDIPAYLDKSKSNALPPASHGKLAKKISLLCENRPEESAAYPLFSRDEAFLARLVLIDYAKVSIDIQYYIFRDDFTSRTIAHKLWQAAERGVRVRFLLDDMQSRKDQDMLNLASHKNIEVRLFNPVKNRWFRTLSIVFNAMQVNRRMHNKSLTVDGHATIVGGRNIGDEYLFSQNLLAFGDLDLIGIGAMVADVSSQFDCYWNSPVSAPIEQLTGHAEDASVDLPQWVEKMQTSSETLTALEREYKKDHFKLVIKDTNAWYWGMAQVIFDDPAKTYSPDDADFTILHHIRELMATATQSLEIVSPYFVPTGKGVKSLVSAIQNKGLSISIVSNSLASNDVVAVHGWYAKYRKRLLKAGVKMWEVKAFASEVSQQPKLKKPTLTGSSRTSLHAKTFVVDDKVLFVGSFNFDPRSANINTELGILFESSDLVNATRDLVNSYLVEHAFRLVISESGKINWIDQSTQTQHKREPQASLWRKFAAFIAGKLPIQKLL